LDVDYRGWPARPSRADLSIILGPVVPFRRTQHALFDVIRGIVHEVYETKHSKHLRHHCASTKLISITTSEADNIVLVKNIL